jgi:hypothetical protein
MTTFVVARPLVAESIELAFDKCPSKMGIAILLMSIGGVIQRSSSKRFNAPRAWFLQNFCAMHNHTVGLWL